MEEFDKSSSAPLHPFNPDTDSPSDYLHTLYAVFNMPYQADFLTFCLLLSEVSFAAGELGRKQDNEVFPETLAQYFPGVCPVYGIYFAELSPEKTEEMQTLGSAAVVSIQQYHTDVCENIRHGIDMPLLGRLQSWNRKVRNITEREDLKAAILLNKYFASMKEYGLAECVMSNPFIESYIDSIGGIIYTIEYVLETLSQGECSPEVLFLFLSQLQASAGVFGIPQSICRKDLSNVALKHLGLPSLHAEELQTLRSLSEIDGKPRIGKMRRIHCQYR